MLRCIEMYSFVGDIVLDPFLGSGTTAIAAKMCGRHWIGFDLNSFSGGFSSAGLAFMSSVKGYFCEPYLAMDEQKIILFIGHPEYLL